MKINLTGHHVDLTTPLRDYVNSKMERLERHFDHVTDTHVVLSVENMYAAIDSLVDKLDRQVKKHKEKMTDHHRSEGSIARDL